MMFEVYTYVMYALYLMAVLLGLYFLTVVIGNLYARSHIKNRYEWLQVLHHTEWKSAVEIVQEMTKIKKMRYQFFLKAIAISDLMILTNHELIERKKVPSEHREVPYKSMYRLTSTGNKKKIEPPESLGVPQGKRV